MFKLCSLPDICQHSVQTAYPGFSVLVFVFVKWISERIEVFKVFMIPNRNQQVCQHFLSTSLFFLLKSVFLKSALITCIEGQLRTFPFLLFMVEVKL